MKLATMGGLQEKKQLIGFAVSSSICFDKTEKPVFEVQKLATAINCLCFAKFSRVTIYALQLPAVTCMFLETKLSLSTVDAVFWEMFMDYRQTVKK